MRWLIARIFGNLGKVDERLYRSGQDWFGYLAWLWVKPKTVINLSHKPKKDLQDKFEQWLCKKLKVTYHEYPTLYEEDVEEIYNLMCNSESPCLIHCEAGKDRTGFMVALYRLIHDGPGEWEDIVNDWWYHKIPHSLMLQRFWAYIFGKKEEPE